MTCDVARCKQPMIVTYAAFNDDLTRKVSDVKVCQRHWEKHCDEKDKFDLRDHFKGSINHARQHKD